MQNLNHSLEQILLALWLTGSDFSPARHDMLLDFWISGFLVFGNSALFHFWISAPLALLFMLLISCLCIFAPCSCTESIFFGINISVIVAVFCKIGDFLSLLNCKKTRLHSGPALNQIESGSEYSIWFNYHCFNLSLLHHLN